MIPFASSTYPLPGQKGQTEKEKEREREEEK